MFLFEISGINKNKRPHILAWDSAIPSSFSGVPWDWEHLLPILTGLPCFKREGRKWFWQLTWLLLQSPCVITFLSVVTLVHGLSKRRVHHGKEGTVVGVYGNGSHREHRERNASVSFPFLLDIQSRILAHGLELPTIREGLSSSVKLETP